MTESQGLTSHVASTDVIELATTKRDGDEVVTPIWGVVVDGAAYIRSAYGGGSTWYRRAQRTHQAALVDGAARYPVAIEDVTDDATNTDVDDAYSQKYADSSSLPDLLTSRAQQFTMRLTPTG